MSRIAEAAILVEAICREQGLPFCFIGGVAVQRWGEPRLTHDVDLTVQTGFGYEAPIVDALLEKLAPRLPDARAFALQNRVLLLVAANGVPVDIALGAMPFEERAIQRATPFAMTDTATVMTCSAEDLIVHKAFAAREKDWLDIAGIVVRQGEHLDRSLVWDELSPLLELKGDSSTEPRLRKLLGTS